ncbi:hypothetical protein DZG01_14650 [Pseudomonas fluorescens]|nr:hypothetical protein DZG01_14650 [Pseudomonas fluorescens]
MQKTVGASLLAIAVYPFAMMLNVPSSSRASSAPTGIGGGQKLETATDPMWERARSRWRCISRQKCCLTLRHREQARSHSGIA